MQAGALRHRIRLMAPVETRDSYNAVVTVYVEQAQAWAAVRPLLGNEFLESMAGGAQVSHRVQIRRRRDVTILPTWQVWFGTRVLQITAPPMDVDERGRELVLMCKELVQP